MTEQMPSNVRIFFWLSALAIACWIGSTVWFSIIPSLSYAATHAKTLSTMRPEARELIVEAERYAAFFALAVTLSFCALTFLFAWLAAFRRQNWARWTFMILFVVSEFRSVSRGFGLSDNPRPAVRQTLV